MAAEESFNTGKGESAALANSAQHEESGAEASDITEEDSADKSDLDDMLSLMGDASVTVRRSGIFLAVFIILVGAYLSRTYGQAFLIGGVILGLLLGGGLSLSAGLLTGTVRRQIRKQDQRGKKK